MQNAIIPKNVIDAHVQKIKDNELTKFEDLCKEYKIYDPVDKKHLKHSYYDSMIIKLDKSISKYKSDNYGMPDDVIHDYTNAIENKIKKYEYVQTQLQNYKQNVETQIAKIPRNTTQILQELKTLIDDICKHLNENISEFYLINIIDTIAAKIDKNIIKEFEINSIFKYIKIDDIPEYKKVVDIIKEAVINKSDNYIITNVVPHIIKMCIPQMCKFVSLYCVLAKYDIIDIQHDVTSILKSFERSVFYNVHDWLLSNINELFIQHTVTQKNAATITKKTMKLYNDNIKNNFNNLYSDYLVKTFNYLNIATYFDKEDINDYLENVKKSGSTNDIQHAKTVVNAYIADAKSEPYVDIDVELKMLESSESNSVKKVIVEEIDDDDVETNSKPTLEGFVNSIPLNKWIKADDLLVMYNNYFKTNVSAISMGKKITDHFQNDRKTIDGKKVKFYMRK